MKESRLALFVCIDGERKNAHEDIFTLYHEKLLFQDIYNAIHHTRLS
jgi:hypothetical protein